MGGFEIEAACGVGAKAEAMAQINIANIKKAISFQTYPRVLPPGVFTGPAQIEWR